MTVIESLEHRTSVLRAREVAALFQVTRQHIYKMAAKGTIPSFRVAGAIRFDPQVLAEWLRQRMPPSEADASITWRRTPVGCVWLEFLIAQASDRWIHRNNAANTNSVRL